MMTESCEQEDKMLTKDQIERAEKDRQATRNALERMARHIVKARRESDVHPEFRLSGYRFGTAASLVDHNPDDDLSVDYPADVEVAVVDLFHARWGDSIEVAFPADYLDGSEAYVEREAAAITARKAARGLQRAVQAEVDDQDARNRRREMYERLRREFDGEPIDPERRKRMVDLARETLAGHPHGKDSPELVLAWLANRAELHAPAVLVFAGETDMAPSAGVEPARVPTSEVGALSS